MINLKRYNESTFESIKHIDEYENLSEDEKRLYQRSRIRKGNYTLNIVTKKAGVKSFDKFHYAGYKGLYGRETADDIARIKKLRYRENILDNKNYDKDW